MRSFHRCLSTIGLLTSTMLGLTLVSSSPAQAVPETQVIAKLQNVPVYVITDAQGTIVQASANNVGKNQPQKISTGVFFSRQDAQSFIDKSLKPQQPDLSKVVKVTPVSLGEIYRRQQANKNKPQELNYIYVPTTQQASSALAILNQRGQKLSQINGLPVFVATIKSKTGTEQYLTFQRDRQEIVPVFFSKEKLESVVKKVYPDLVNKSNIQVIELNSLLGYMTTTNDPVINSFEFNPNLDDK
jgi:hypothetical protein